MKANCSKEERAERLKCRIEEFLLKKDKQWRRAKDRAEIPAILAISERVLMGTPFDNVVKSCGFAPPVKGLFPILTKGTDE